MRISAGSFSLRTDVDESAFTDLYTLGIGLGAGATGESTSTVEGTSSVDIADNVHIETSGDVLVSAAADRLADADADSVSGGAIAYGGIQITAELDSTNAVTVGSGITIASHGNVTIEADSTVSTSGTADGGSGSLIDIAAADGDSTLEDTSSVSIGDTTSVSAVGDVVVRALHDVDVDIDASVDSGGVGSNADTHTTVTVTTATTVDVGAAAFEGARITLKSVVEDIDIDIVAEAESGAIGADTDATATLSTTSEAEVTVGSGAALTAERQVTIGTYHDRIDADSNSIATAKALGGDSDSTASNTLDITESILTERGSIITTRSLLVEADADTTPIYSADATLNGAAFDTGTETETPDVTYDRSIDFNSTVVMLGADSPLLEIDENGNEVRRVDVEYQVVGNRIQVADILNDGSLNGTIVIRVTTSTLDSDSSATTVSQIKGNPVWDFLMAFESVTLINASGMDLRIGDIDVINHTGQFDAAITISAEDVSLFAPTQQTSNGATLVEILNTSAPDVLLSGTINNPYGTTRIFTAGGSILAVDTAARIDTDLLELLAPAGAVGSSSAAIRISASRLTARGSSAVYVEQTAGDMYVVEASADLATGVVSLRSARSILDANDTAFPDIQAHDIALVAATGSLGTSANALEIDAAGNSLDAAAAGSITIADVAGALGVGLVESTSGNIDLRTVDTDAGGEDIVLGVSSIVRSLAGAVTLLSADDILAAVGSGIVARNVVTLRADDEDAYDGVAGNGIDRDSGRGAAVELRGSVAGSAVVITTGTDPDVVSLTGTYSATSIDTRANNDRIRIGSLAQTASNTGGVLDYVAGAITVEGGSGIDTLDLDDTGDTRDNTGTVSATAVTGFGMTASVGYAGIDDLRLSLGSGADIVTVTGTASGSATTILLGSGADTVNVGDATAGLNAIFGVLTVDGQGDSDTLSISDAGTLPATANAGRLETGRLLGFGMGSASQTTIDPDLGLRWGAVEQIGVTLGSGIDTLTVLGIDTSTTLNAGAGVDVISLGSLAAGGGLASIAAALTVHGGSDGATLNVASAAKADVTLTRTSSTLGRITEAGAAGRVDFDGVTLVSVRLGDADNALSIVDTVAPVDVTAGSGSDSVSVDNLSHATSLHLGDGADSVVVRAAAAALSVSGEGGSSDRDSLELDLTGLTAAVDGTVSGSGTAGSLNGFTTAAIAFDTIEDLRVRLGSGNDTVAIAHALSATDVMVEGASGDDTMTVTSIGGGLTTLTGGDAFDTVKVVIPRRTGRECVHESAAGRGPSGGRQQRQRGTGGDLDRRRRGADRRRCGRGPRSCDLRRRRQGNPRAGRHAVGHVERGEHAARGHRGPGDRPPGRIVRGCRGAGVRRQRAVPRLRQGAELRCARHGQRELLRGWVHPRAAAFRFARTQRCGERGRPVHGGPVRPSDGRGSALLALVDAPGVDRGSGHVGEVHRNDLQWRHRSGRRSGRRCRGRVGPAGVPARRFHQSAVRCTGEAGVDSDRERRPADRRRRGHTLRRIGVRGRHTRRRAGNDVHGRSDRAAVRHGQPADRRRRQPQWRLQCRRDHLCLRFVLLRRSADDLHRGHGRHGPRRRHVPGGRSHHPVPARRRPGAAVGHDRHSDDRQRHRQPRRQPRRRQRSGDRRERRFRLLRRGYHRRPGGRHRGRRRHCFRFAEQRGRRRSGRGRRQHVGHALERRKRRRRD
ncbi:MAG: hypothetical protein IPK20_11560 [Betaproteobacteria bacterium]|nr:hypothetical protein [Betaproteobacteria bacterium]